MRTETLHSVPDYINEAFNFIVGNEGFRNGEPYFDTANPTRATIGYGFNIEVSNYLLLVLEQMGIVNDSMTSTQINTIRSAFTTEINRTPHTGDRATIERQLQANLNRVAQQYGVSTFRIDTTQGYNIFSEIIQGATIGGIAIPGKQPRLDNLLQSTLAHNSKEYVALLSLFYNREDLITSSTPGGSIADAVINDDRIRAWYLIRYRRNGGSRSQGIANRRYRESDLFGLWNSGGPTTPEIQRFEEFLKQADPYNTGISMLQYMRNYEAGFTPKTAEANNSRTIDEQINNETAVKNYFVSQYGRGENIDGNVILGTELANKVVYTTNALTISQIKAGYLKSTENNDLILGDKGADELNGGLGNDVIYGGTANDTLIGGAGADILIGGTGFDTYIYRSGDGNDRIYDDDGFGRIVILSQDGSESEYAIGTFYKDENGAEIWRSPDGTITVSHNSPWKITLPDGSTIDLGENFESGDFGINLLDAPVEPTLTGITLEGDLKPMDFDPNEPGIQYRQDAFGNIITDPNQPDPDREDSFSNIKNKEVAYAY
ncbi:MAG: hypothetical protein JXR79_00400 [Nitrospirae bacterium]|nr:hypothetical protein [Nitrospirota bacterium]